MTKSHREGNGYGGPTNRASLKHLLDFERGLISRKIFVDQDVFEMELESLFSRAWLFVGHTSQIPDPGDYFVSRMGTDSVILTRDSEGDVNVLLNSCRHRGMKLCRYDEGNTLRLRCTYHGWTYSIDGALVSTPGELYAVPQYRKTYSEAFDKAQWGLVPVPRVTDYKGLIFANWDPEAVDFEEYLGGFKLWLDNLTDAIDGDAGATEALPGVQKWRVGCNWKLATENFLGDSYHAPTTHASVEAVGIGPGGPSATRHGGKAKEFDLGATSFKYLGHGAASTRVTDTRPYPNFEEPELDEYFSQAWRKRAEAFAQQGRPVAAFGASMLFPNMSFHPSGFPKSILVTHPISPTETEMWRWYLVDQNLPDAARQWLRHYYLRYSGPGGMTEQDDMENWAYATEASLGHIAQRYDYNYQQGMGLAAESTIEGAVEAEGATEENARNFYRRWEGFVSGASWDELRAPEKFDDGGQGRK